MDVNGLRAGRLTTIRPLDEPMAWVDPRDIATVAAVRLLADDWTGRQVQAVHGPADLTWTEVAAALSTATGVSIEARRITDDEERAALRDAGMGEVAVEGIVGMGVGTRDGFTPEQPRSVLTTTPSSLAGWAITHLRPALPAALKSFGGGTRTGGGTSPYFRRRLVGDPFDLPGRIGTAEHEDRARLIAGSDRDVLGSWRGVQIVPLAHVPLFASTTAMHSPLGARKPSCILNSSS